MKTPQNPIDERLEEILILFYATVGRETRNDPKLLDDYIAKSVAQLKILVDEARIDEWEWIRQNMPYTDQGALFEARAAKRVKSLQKTKDNKLEEIA